MKRFSPTRALALPLLAASLAVLPLRAQDADIALLPVEQIQARASSYTPLDISGAANMDFQDDAAGNGRGGWTDQGANSLAGFPTGRQIFEGIPFQISATRGHQVLVLRGQSKEQLPTRAEIAINQKGAALYVLHTSAWTSERPAAYTVRYDDGTSERAELQRGRDIFDWWSPQDGARVRAAWRGKNAEHDPIGLGLWAWRNPHPNKTMASLVAETPGDAAFVMIAGVTVSAEAPVLSKRPPKAYDLAGWFPAQPVDVAKRRGTLLDASKMLHAPAGKFGRVRARGEHFVLGSGRKTRAQKFWGVNIVASANFPTHEQAERWAEQLAQMGVNITRHHHADAAWSRPNVFGNKPSTQVLDAESMERLDYFIAQLQKRGIYQYFDLIVHRAPQPEDQIPAPEDVASGFKIEGEFDPLLIAEQEKFTRAFLSHYNPYIRSTYARSPGVAMLEIINEDSLLYRAPSGDFGINSAHYKNVFDGQWNQWLARRFSDRQVLAARWKPQADEPNAIGLREEEDAARGSVENVVSWESNDDWRKFSRARARDNYAFYCETMRDYFGRITRAARSAGFEGIIAGSNHWTGQVADLRLNAELDYVDRHDYWAHPSGGYGYATGVTFDPRPMSRDPKGGMAASLGSRRVLGRPYIVTEWQASAPNDYRVEGAPFMAALCAAQNWSAIQFAWSHSNNPGPALESNFDIISQPTMRDTWPALSTMLYRGDLPAFSQTFAARVSDAEAFEPASRVWGRVPDGLVFSAKTGVAFDGYRPGRGERIVTSSGVGEGGKRAQVLAQLRALSPQAPAPLVMHDAQAGVLKIDTPRSQGFVGFGESKAQSMRDVEVSLENPFGFVLATSADGRDLRRSKRILISALGNALNTGMEISGEGNAVVATGSAPVLVEPLRGVVRLPRARARRLRVWALDVNGQRSREVPVLRVLDAQRKEIGAAFEMKAEYRALHYEVARR